MGGLDRFDLVPVLFAVLGTVFFVVGLRGLVSGVRFRFRAVPCGGVVSGFRREWSSGTGNSSGKYLYYPILAFRTLDGRDVRTVSPEGTSWTRLETGQQVGVRYDPRDPSVAYVGQALASLVVPLVSAALGLLFASVGLDGVIDSGIPARLLHLLGAG